MDKLKGFIFNFSAIVLTAAMVFSAAVLTVGCKVRDVEDSAEDMQSDIVTEEEWIAAFQTENFFNFKVACREFNGEGERNCVLEDTTVWDEEKLYLKHVSEGFDDGNEYYQCIVEEYIEYINGIPKKTYWRTSNVNDLESGEWRYDSFFMSHSAAEAEELRYRSLSYIEIYEDFEYSETDKGYVYYCDNLIYCTEKSILKFRDGKLVAKIVKFYDIGAEDSFLTQEYLLTYGGQVVTFPIIFSF